MSSSNQNGDKSEETSNTPSSDEEGLLMKKDNLQIHQILRGQEGIAHHTKLKEGEKIHTKP